MGVLSSKVELVLGLSIRSKGGKMSVPLIPNLSDCLYRSLCLEPSPSRI